MDGNEELYRDEKNRIWMRHNEIVDITCLPSAEKSHVFLPFYVIPMWPDRIDDPGADLVYCICAVCGKFTSQMAQLALGFQKRYWNVGIRCQSCYPEMLQFTSYCTPVMTVQERLEPILSAACKKRDNTCEICEKENGCDNPDECKQTRILINRSETEDLFEYFYRIRLDVVSVLRFRVCHRLFCDNLPKQRMVNCQVCHRVCYCSEECKRLDKTVHEGVCVPFEEVWRP